MWVDLGAGTLNGPWPRPLLGPSPCSSSELQTHLKSEELPATGAARQDSGITMATVRTLLYLGVWVSTWSPNSADYSHYPTAENIHWVSLDFTSILNWTVPRSEITDFSFTVLFSEDDSDWQENPDCIQMSPHESQCDLTVQLDAQDRTFYADVKTEPLNQEDLDPDALPHTDSLPFNPYRQSNISAANFYLVDVNDTTVLVNISDPLTAIHRRSKQLTIRDILKNDLKYKIIYYKSGNTGKRDIISDTSVAMVPDLDPGENYCFIVAAFIPSRAPNSQQGLWSPQLCTDRQDKSVAVRVGVIFIGLTALIIIVMVTVLCCRNRRQGNKTLQQMSQSSAPV